MPIEEFSVKENKLVQNAGNKYGEYYRTAKNCIILTECIKYSSEEGMIFVHFWSQISTNLQLALLSTVRRHTVQTYMLLRQVLESSTYAYYGLYLKSFEKFGNISSKETFKIKENVKNPAHQWLNKFYPKQSNEIKSLKLFINQNFAHANIGNTQFSVIEHSDRKKSMYFFDHDKNSIHIKRMFLLIIEIANLVLSLLKEVLKDNNCVYLIENKEIFEDSNCITLIDDFDTKLEESIISQSIISRVLLEEPLYKTLNI